METSTKSPAPASASTPSSKPSNPNATQTRNLSIEGMTGDACVQKVKTALKDVPAVTTQSVKVGSATIEADKAGCDASCKAVDAAGFKCHAANTGTAGTHDANMTGEKQARDPNDSTQKPGISNASTKGADSGAKPQAQPMAKPVAAH